MPEEIIAESSPATAANPVSVSIGRQPIFDDKRKLWGYELFCVGSDGAANSGFPEETSVAIHVQSSAYVCLRHFMDSGKKIVVDFSEKGILENLPYVLPPAVAALRVPERVAEEPSLMELLESLKSDGYVVLVEASSGNARFAPLYRFADIIGIDCGGPAKEELRANAASLRQYGASLLATRVQGAEMFKACQEAGFSLFHGPFFKAPDRITARKLSSNEALRFQLLQLIENDEPDLGRLGERIVADATISFRLLAYLNSSAFGFVQKITSIQQAAALLGWYNLRNWLRVVLLTDIGQTKAAHELVILSAQRGLFLELIARDHDFWGFDPARLHLVGLFSLLDALMGMPMTEIVGNLSLDHKMKKALCQEPGSEFLPLIRLAQCLEEARWAGAATLIQQLNLDSAKVRAAFQKSIDWASQLETAS